jgi:hypothetical protein
MRIYGWLLLGAGLLFLVLLCLALRIGKGTAGIRDVLWPRGVTKGNVLQIHRGMSRKEVERILGPVWPMNASMDNIPLLGSEGSAYRESVELIGPPDTPKYFRNRKQYLQVYYAGRIDKDPNVLPVGIAIIYDEQEKVFSAVSMKWWNDQEPSDPEPKELRPDPSLWSRVRQRWQDYWQGM